MTLLSTIYYWLVFVLTAPLVLLFGTIVFVVTAPFDDQRRTIHAFICAVAFNYVRVNPFWRTKVAGRERIPEGPCVIVVNHQSMADVIAVMGIRAQFKFVSKASLFKLPIVGWMMKMAKYVAVERGRHSSMQKMMDECRAWLRAGMSVLIFPEGTYSPDGKLLPFKRGAFQLAISERVPLVPVVMKGTRDLVIEDGPWMSPKAHVEIEVMEPVPAGELGDDDSELTERVRAVMAKALGQAE
ncbi:MAG: lysophospholipid acyltransferase family protein [Myxococcaceae bacterium]